MGIILNVLITGGAGFVGSHLIERFISKQYNVTVIDNLLTGSKKNVEPFIENDNFTFIDFDVQHHIEISQDLDYVLHLASAASPKAYTQHPINTLKAGSIGTINTLGLAKAKGAKYLLTSTSEVYGDPQISPQPETYWGNVNPNGVRSMYDEAKRFAEAAVASYNRIYNLDTRIVRLFNTYGPKMKINDGRVVTNFISQAISGEDITIYGNGNQTRSFCYIDDLIESIVKIMNTPNITGPINIGNPNEFKIKELACLVRDLINPNLEFEFKEMPKDDPKQRKPDISKAKSKLGWEPKVNLEDGLIKTIDWVEYKLTTE